MAQVRAVTAWEKAVCCTWTPILDCFETKRLSTGIFVTVMSPGCYF